MNSITLNLAAPLYTLTYFQLWALIGGLSRSTDGTPLDSCVSFTNKIGELNINDEYYVKLFGDRNIDDGEAVFPSLGEV